MRGDGKPGGPAGPPASVRALADLPLADLALSASGPECRAKSLADGLMLSPLPAPLWAEAESLYQALLGQEQARFRFLWTSAGAPAITLRVQRRDTARGVVFVARRLDAVPRAFSDLGLPASVTRRLMDPNLRAGLILFAGGPGAGKTTAACALLLARLSQSGGFTWTAENPVEYDMQGDYGAGQCYQEEIADDADVSRVLSDTLRSSADTFYIGEIREQAAARTACLAAASGMLVVSTIHADNAQQALVKLGLLADLPSVAQTLQALITLHLLSRRSAQGMTRILKAEPFFVTEEQQRMKIREGQVASLKTDIERQTNALLMGRSF